MAKSASNPSRSTGVALTRHLRVLAAQVDAVSDGGDLISKSEKLAEIVWQRAIGFQEKTADGKLIPHKPEQWAIMLLFDRLEGRVPVMIDDKTGQTLADKVTALGRSRLNALIEVERDDHSVAGGDPDGTPPGE